LWRTRERGEGRKRKEVKEGKRRDKNPGYGLAIAGPPENRRRDTAGAHRRRHHM